MEQATSNALDALFQKESWSAEDIEELVSLLGSVPRTTATLRQHLADLKAGEPSPSGTTAVKIGVAEYLLCRFREALEIFSDATDNKERRFYAAECLRSLRRFDEAAEEFQRAKARGWDEARADFRTVEAHALAGDLDQARQVLKAMGTEAAASADGEYLQGLLAELSGQTVDAIGLYEKARNLQSGHPEATFRLAYTLDLHGEEEEAIELYEQCASRPPVYVNALMNLAVLHEDAGRYDDACHCLRRILQVNPNHSRAQLFLKDAEASKDMYYDEAQARRIAKRNAVLDIPVTDFELSVRARNCLKKMNIRSLGDLVRTTESELLGYKNFGETSLKEIKEMLAAKGLRLGQALEEEGDYSSQASLEEPEPEQVNDGIRSKPIEQIEFSVRARRVLESLGVKTLGDLADKTEAELLAQKNFGQTSLNEMRQRLTENGLNFRDSV